MNWGAGSGEQKAARLDRGILTPDSYLLRAGDVFFSLKMRLISPILGHTVSVTKHYITQVAFPLLP
jgi:hypothetical protein